ncbi:hypothetical protein [Prescottella agglutinans]|uniref:Uncharacterized protein n=1 Tax=Prescottella agglutinans TaxID=1644129 RepID=A0ABT6MI42_9NOCA|nr:hypothetical protein [Prescottella agglutinans]MDH6283984.1 hypothetical protein [Prescottella agglutinans]
MFEMVPWPLYAIAGCIVMLIAVATAAVAADVRANTLDQHVDQESVAVSRWRRTADALWLTSGALSAATLASWVLLLL